MKHIKKNIRQEDENILINRRNKGLSNFSVQRITLLDL
jgi:hypothetical protein